MKKKAFLTMTVIASLLAMASCDGKQSLPTNNPSSSADTTTPIENTTTPPPTTTTTPSTPTTPDSTTTPGSTSVSSSTGTSTSDTSSGTDSTVSSPSSGTSGSSSSGSEYVTESLNNGYEVKEGVPNYGSDIEVDDIIDFIAFIGEECTPYDPLAGEDTERQLREIIEEKGLPILKKGGVGKEFVDKLEKILTDNPAYGQTINAIASGGINITEEQVSTLANLLKDIVTASSQDQFASSLMALFAFGQSRYPTNIYGYFGILTQTMYEFVLEVASEPYKAFFQGVMEDSVSPFVEPAFYPDVADEETQFFFLRLAHQMLSTMFEKIDMEEITSFLGIVLKGMLQGEGGPSTEEMLPVINTAGKIITDCFPNRDSFKKMIGYIASAIENTKDYDAAALNLTSFTGAEQRAVCYNSELAANVSKLQENSDEVFNGLKFLAAFAKNMTMDQYQAIMNVVSSFQGETIGEEVTSPVVILSKALTSTSTGFSVDNDKVWAGLKRLVKDGVKIFNSILQGTDSSGGSYAFGTMTLGLSDSTFDKIFDKVKEVSGYDPAKLTAEQKTDIVDFVSDIRDGFAQDSLQTMYQLTVPFYFQKGDTLSITLNKMDTTMEEPETIPVAASDVTGFDTESYHYGLASFEKEGLVFSFTYLVAPENGYKEIAIEGNKNFVAKGETPEIYGITYDDLFMDLEAKDFIGFSTKERGHFVAFLPVEDTYYAFEYYVYDPETDVERTYQIQDALYQNDIAYRNYGVSRRTKVTYDDVVLSDQYDSYGTTSTYLDLTTAGKKTEKLAVNANDSVSPVEVDVDYTVEEAKSIEHYLSPSYQTNYYGYFGYENAFIQNSNDMLDVIKDWDDLKLIGKVTLEDGGTRTISYDGMEVETKIADIPTFEETLKDMDLSQPGEQRITFDEEGSYAELDKEGNKTSKTVPIHFDYQVWEGSIDGGIDPLMGLEFDSQGKLLTEPIEAMVWVSMSYREFHTENWIDMSHERQIGLSVTLPDEFVPDPEGGEVEVIANLDGYHLRLTLPYQVLE